MPFLLHIKQGQDVPQADDFQSNHSQGSIVNFSAPENRPDVLFALRSWEEQLAQDPNRMPVHPSTSASTEPWTFDRDDESGRRPAEQQSLSSPELEQQPRHNPFLLPIHLHLPTPHHLQRGSQGIHHLSGPILNPIQSQALPSIQLPHIDTILDGLPSILLWNPQHQGVDHFTTRRHYRYIATIHPQTETQTVPDNNLTGTESWRPLSPGSLMAATLQARYLNRPPLPQQQQQEQERQQQPESITSSPIYMPLSPSMQIRFDRSSHTLSPPPALSPTYTPLSPTLQTTLPRFSPPTQQTTSSGHPCSRPHRRPQWSGPLTTSTQILRSSRTFESGG